MNRLFLLLVIFLLLAGAGGYWWSTKQNIAPVMTLSADLYPLYGNANWSAPQVEEFTIGTSSYTGASVTSLPVSNTMDPGKIFTPFEEYYDQKLKSLGWQVANDLAAGGHVGGQTGYRKGGAIILTRFLIDYKNNPENAPSECPCDVSLSLFSTVH